MILNVMTDYDADAHVAKGVAVLDEKVPDWRDRVDAERLVMSSTWECILGQVFHNEAEASDDRLETGYSFGMPFLFGAAYDADRESVSIDNGFEAPYRSEADEEYGSRDYNSLTAAWLAVLT
jgi:hypothetical protein